MKHQTGHIGFVLVLIALAILCMIACTPDKPLTAEQQHEVERQYSAQADTYSEPGNNFPGGN